MTKFLLPLFISINGLLFDFFDSKSKQISIAALKRTNMTDIYTKGTFEMEMERLKGACPSFIGNSNNAIVRLYFCDNVYGTLDGASTLFILECTGDLNLECSQVHKLHKREDKVDLYEAKADGNYKDDCSGIGVCKDTQIVGNMADFGKRTKKIPIYRPIITIILETELQKKIKKNGSTNQKFMEDFISEFYKISPTEEVAGTNFILRPVFRTEVFLTSAPIGGALYKTENYFDEVKKAVESNGRVMDTGIVHSLRYSKVAGGSEGRAFLKTICTGRSFSYSAIRELRKGAFVFKHELMHTFGIPHGQSDDLMKAGSGATHLSPESIRKLDAYLKRVRPEKCMEKFTDMDLSKTITDKPKFEFTKLNRKNKPLDPVPPVEKTKLERGKSKVLSKSYKVSKTSPEKENIDGNDSERRELEKEYMLSSSKILNMLASTMKKLLSGKNNN